MPRIAVEDNSRMSLRVRAEEKALLMRAVALEHTDLTDFVLQHALRAAKTVIEQADHVQLSGRDSLRVLDLLESSPELRDRVHGNARYFRTKMQALGFELLPGEHPIIPIMLGEAPLAVRLAERMQELGIYVVAFSFPVVPHGKARIRTQMNAAHTEEQLDRVVQAFGQAGRDRRRDRRAGVQRAGRSRPERATATCLSAAGFSVHRDYHDRRQREHRRHVGERHRAGQ